MNMWKECKSLQEELVKTRRELHQIPEFGFDLPKTQAYVIRILAVSYTHLDVYKRQPLYVAIAAWANVFSPRTAYGKNLPNCWSVSFRPYSL